MKDWTLAIRTAKRTYNTEVICLKTYPYGEADKILHLYSPERGLVSAMAKGVKKSTSKLAGVCEVLNHSQVQLSEGSGLQGVCQYQTLSSFSGLRSDIFKLAYGMLFAELVHLVSAEHDADSLLIFDALHGALSDLNRADSSGDFSGVVRIGVRFQMALLNISGYQPNLTECMVTGRPVSAEEPYYCFSSQLGGIVHQGMTGNYPAAVWVPVSTSTLRTLAALSDEALWEAARPLKVQKFLRYFYAQLFERKMRAFDFLFALLEEPSAPAVR